MRILALAGSGILAAMVGLSNSLFGVVTNAIFAPPPGEAAVYVSHDIITVSESDSACDSV